MRVFAFAVAVVLLMSCNCGEPGQVTMISDHEGCRLYQVRDGGCIGRTVYYSDCGDTSWTQQEGKAYHNMQVPNARPKEKQ